MAKISLPTSDYTNLVKEYTPVGQKQTLWEQFFTGTQQAYQNLTQETQDVYSYDISQAYANYKQQQLQLQMNEQLGEGFREQLGAQLKSQYGSAYKDIKSQEQSALSKIATQYASDIEKGTKEFTKLGSQLKTFDAILSDYAEYAGVKTPENMYQETVNDDGTISYDLTDYGRLWYSDVINATPEGKKLLDQWLLSDEYKGDLEYEDREAIWEAYRQNPDLFKSQIAGIDSDFDAEKLRTEIVEKEKIDVIQNANEEFRQYNTDEIDDDTLNKLKENEYYIYSSSLKSSKTKFVKPGDTFKDNKGVKWEYDKNPGMLGNWHDKNDKKYSALAKQIGISKDQLKAMKDGDIMHIEDNYYVFMHNSKTGNIKVVKIKKK